MQEAGKSLKKKSLIEQFRIAGFHARSIAWTLISGRPIDYSFKKRKALETGEFHGFDEQAKFLSATTPFFIVSVIGGSAFLTLTGSVASLLFLPLGFAIFALRGYHHVHDSTDIALEKRVTKMQKRLSDRKHRRTMQGMLSAK